MKNTTAKQIYDLIRNKPYKDGEKMIIGYAEQKVKERDKQWFDTMVELGHLTDTELIDEVNEKLPNIQFK